MELINKWKSYVPNDWTSQYEEAELVELSSYSSQYLLVKRKLEGSALRGLEKICQIQNPYLYHRYQIRKLEYQNQRKSFNEMTLFHATGAAKINSIIKNNLDWRLVSRCKFGRGVSFSPCSVYANKECSRLNGCFRAVILAKVLVGSKCSGSYSMRIPSVSYDTSGCSRGNVYVKYYDDEFYPEYVAYYIDT